MNSFAREDAILREALLNDGIFHCERFTPIGVFVFSTAFQAISMECGPLTLFDLSQIPDAL